MNGGRLPEQIVFDTLRVQCGEDGVGRRKLDQLRTERHPGIWHNGGLESDGMKG